MCHTTEGPKTPAIPGAPLFRWGFHAAPRDGGRQETPEDSTRWESAFSPVVDEASDDVGGLDGLDVGGLDRVATFAVGEPRAAAVLVKFVTKRPDADAQ